MSLAKAKFDEAVKAADRLQQLRSKVTSEERNATEEELTQMKTAADEYRALKAEAESILESEKIAAEAEEVREYPLFADPELKADQPDKPQKAEKSVLPEGALYSERKAFDAFMRGGMPLDADLRKGLITERKAFGEAQDATGGVLVPEQMASFIYSKKNQINVLKSRCTVIPNLGGGSFVVPTFMDDEEPSAILESGSFSELTAGGFGKSKLTPHKFGLLWKIPEEMLEDVPAVESFLQQHYAIRAAVREEDQILNGTGAGGYPLGLLLATFNTVNDISGTTDDVYSEDFISAKLALSPAYRMNAVYICPNLTMGKIWKFRSEEGGSGTGSYLFQPSYSLGQPDVLCGKPVLESESFDDPASDGDCMFLFGDLSTVYFVAKAGIVVQRLNELYAGNGQVGFRLKWRFDCSPIDKYAFARYNRS